MNFNNLISNLKTAFLAQGISFLLSMVMSLVVPKVLGVEEYGYWQLFVFYTSYVGLFHFGLSDGVYLINGGITRDELNNSEIKSQLVFGLIYQSIFAISIVIFALFCIADVNRQFVVFATAVFLILSNTTTYLGYVFQSINETKLFSYSVMIDRIVFLIPLVFLVLLGVTSFEAYIAAFAFSKTCSLAFCLYHSKTILRSQLLTIHETLAVSWNSIRVGICLMLANIASMLILGVARFAVDATWGLEQFAEFSFALSIVNFFAAFISQIAMVLFPALRQTGEDDKKRFFANSRDVLSVALPFVYLFYIPLKVLLILWLPQYASALDLLALLLPLCVFDGKMSIVGTTFFKVLRQEKRLLLINALSVLVSIAGVALGILVFNSAVLAIESAVVAVCARCCISEFILSRELEVSPNPTLMLSCLLISAVFSITSYLYSDGLALAVTALMCLVSSVSNRKLLALSFRKLKGSV